MQVSEQSAGLKLIARSYDLTLVAAAQLNRKCEERKDKRPQMADIRESGAIEQDTDVVLFLYRDDYYNDDSPDKGIVEINVAKHRGGATGVVRVAWEGVYTRLSNLAQPWREGDAPADRSPEQRARDSWGLGK